MYLDKAPHMWPEIEGREDLVVDEVTSTWKKDGDILGSAGTDDPDNLHMRKKFQQW